MEQEGASVEVLHFKVKSVHVFTAHTFAYRNAHVFVVADLPCAVIFDVRFGTDINFATAVTSLPANKCFDSFGVVNQLCCFGSSAREKELILLGPLFFSLSNLQDDKNYNDQKHKN